MCTKAGIGSFEMSVIHYVLIRKGLICDLVRNHITVRISEEVAKFMAFGLL